MSSGAPCIVCSFARSGEHEPWCPHFMRGPDPGGDPAEWPTLLELLEPAEEPTP
jgi:hypothetical protein